MAVLFHPQYSPAWYFDTRYSAINARILGQTLNYCCNSWVHGFLLAQVSSSTPLYVLSSLPTLELQPRENALPRRSGLLLGQRPSKGIPQGPDLVMRADTQRGVHLPRTPIRAKEPAGQPTSCLVRLPNNPEDIVVVYTAVGR